jgi:hypothetical protein
MTGMPPAHGSPSTLFAGDQPVSKTRLLKHALRSGALSFVLRGLPAGTPAAWLHIYKVSAVATTVLNQRLSGSRTYRSCAKGSVKIKLHRVKKLTTGQGALI